MAQLGDLVRAKALLQSAASAFGRKEAAARARRVVSRTWPSNFGSKEGPYA